MELCVCKGITKLYHPGKPNEVAALKNVDITIKQGETVAIQGPSGSGKSTLLHILGCLDSSTSGEYFFEGETVQFANSRRVARLRGEKIGFVLQQYGLLEEQTVLDNVTLPVLFGKQSMIKAGERAQEILQRLGIQNLRNKRVRQLSGGEKQRVAIARALINDPALILADEPTGALDSATGAQIVRLLLSLAETGKTVVIVTHDSGVAAQCGRHVTIQDGILTEQAGQHFAEIRNVKRRKNNAKEVLCKASGGGSGDRRGGLRHGVWSFRRSQQLHERQGNGHFVLYKRTADERDHHGCDWRRQRLPHFFADDIEL